MLTTVLGLTASLQRISGQWHRPYRIFQGVVSVGSPSLGDRGYRALSRLCADDDKTALTRATDGRCWRKANWHHTANFRETWAAVNIAEPLFSVFNYKYLRIVIWRAKLLWRFLIIIHNALFILFIQLYFHCDGHWEVLTTRTHTHMHILVHCCVAQACQPLALMLLGYKLRQWQVQMDEVQTHTYTHGESITMATYKKNTYTDHVCSQREALSHASPGVDGKYWWQVLKVNRLGE